MCFEHVFAGLCIWRISARGKVSGLMWLGGRVMPHELISRDDSFGAHRERKVGEGCSSCIINNIYIVIYIIINNIIVFNNRYNNI